MREVRGEELLDCLLYTSDPIRTVQFCLDKLEMLKEIIRERIVPSAHLNVSREFHLKVPLVDIRNNLFGEIVFLYIRKQNDIGITESGAVRSRLLADVAGKGCSVHTRY